MKLRTICVLLIIHLEFIYSSSEAQIVAWNLTSATTTATTSNSNITTSAISVVPSSTISYQSNPGDIYCGSWSTSATFSTSGKYWEFSITPNYGYEIAISSITFKAGRTSAGPQKIQVQYSLDGFATGGITALGETTNANTSSLDLFTLTAIPPTTSQQITFRIWGYGASGTGNFRLNNIVINGNVNSTSGPGSGIGQVSLIPTILKFNQPSIIRFVVKAAGDTINGLQIIKPATLNWDTNSVSLSPDSLDADFIGDTILLSNITLVGQDSITVSIDNVDAIDTTSTVSILVQTHKGSGIFGPISTLPQLLVYGSPRPMSQIKEKQPDGTYTLSGKRVIVQGIVTAANEFGGPSYLQDETAGIAVYDSSVSKNVTIGDEVVLFGIVTSYRGMFELQPCSIIEKKSEGNLFDTLTVNIGDIKNQNQKGIEPYECQLIRVNNINTVMTLNGSPATLWAVSGSGTNYDLLSGSDTLEIRIDAEVNLANKGVPTSNFDVVGVLGQFDSFYQILPRSDEDIIIVGAGPRIIYDIPYETHLTSTSVTFNFASDAPGTTIVNYGLTSFYDSTFVDTAKVVNHSVTINGLNPATIYNVRLGSTNLSGTTYTSNFLVSTASQTSTGVINVYFNKPVNTALAFNENAQTVNIKDKIIERINAAKYSIDVALYSLSSSVGTSIASALTSAKNRGVKVRVIGEADNSSGSGWGIFPAQGIPNIFDTYDAANAGSGYMHNKFFVIDNRSAVSDTDDWIITGSWNATDSGNEDDAQNIIEIQDKALANAYTIEFNEMWGSDTDTPNASSSRFGARKVDNTPHCFFIQGIPIELYFSPSDRTTSHIIKTIEKATTSIDFALLTFTRSDIANALITKKNSGIKVHGIFDNRSDVGSAFTNLSASGVDVRLKGSDVTGFFHHKYAIIDGETRLSHQYVITGSHNWSNNAENWNNENTLIINSQRIANLYLQEFSARYSGAGGTDILMQIEQVDYNIPKEYCLSQNYPNPFNPTTRFEFSLPTAGNVNIKVYDLLGREVSTILDEMKQAGNYSVTWNASSLTSGVYFYKIQSGGFTSVRKAILLK